MTGGISSQTIAIRSNNNISDFNAVGLNGWTGSTTVYCASNTVNGAANYLLGIGSSGTMGWIETPKMNLSGGGGDFSVTFRAGIWSGDSTSIHVLHVLGNGTVHTNTITGLSATTMQTFVVNGTGGTASSSIRFTARVNSNNRFFLDDVLIEGEPVTLRIDVASVTADVFAGKTVSAVVEATDVDIPILAKVDSTNIPVGNPYSFDGINFSWTPQVTGNFWVKFTVANQTSSAEHTLFITVGLPDPNVPTVTTTPGSILLSWEPVPGATGYTVQVYKLATEVDVFTEDFSECVASGTPINWTSFGETSGQLTGFGMTVLSGWTGANVCGVNATNSVGVTNHLVRMGLSGASRGWIQTPPIDLSVNGGECTLTFRAGNWYNLTTSSGDTPREINVLHIYEEAGEVKTNTLANITGLSNTTMTKYTVHVTGGTANSMICFSGLVAGANANRFFLDDVRLSYITEGKFEVPSSQIVINGTTARVFGLPPLSEYLCTVTALDGISETVSPEVPVRTTASTLIIMR